MQTIADSKNCVKQTLELCHALLEKTNCSLKYNSNDHKIIVLYILGWGKKPQTSSQLSSGKKAISRLNWP